MRNRKRGMMLRMLAVMMMLVLVIGTVPVSAASAKKNVTVKNQKELNKALNVNTVKKIIVKSDAEKLKIKKGDYSNKKLVIDAGKTKFTNYGSFKNITLKNADTFKEAANGNTIIAKEESSTIIVAKGSEVKKLDVQSYKIDIDVLGKAKVGDLVTKIKGAEVNLNVGKKADVNVTLSKKSIIFIEGSKQAKINIDSKAKNSTITASVPVNITAEESLNAQFNKGAEQSVIDSVSEDVKVKISGEAASAVTEKVAGQVIEEPEKVNADTDKKADEKEAEKDTGSAGKDSTTTTDNTATGTSSGNTSTVTPSGNSVTGTSSGNNGTVIPSDNTSSVTPSDNTGTGTGTNSGNNTGSGSGNDNVAQTDEVQPQPGTTDTEEPVTPGEGEETGTTTEPEESANPGEGEGTGTSAEQEEPANPGEGEGTGTSAEQEEPANPAEGEGTGTTTESVTPDEVYDKIIALKTDYPEGKSWTNDNTYVWEGNVLSIIMPNVTAFTGGGCAGFAMLASDAAFGDLPAYKYTDVSKVRVGDILRLDNDNHSVIVLTVSGKKITVAEGNFNSSIHWGREIEDVTNAGFVYGYTRYDDPENYTPEEGNDEPETPTYYEVSTYAELKSALDVYENDPERTINVVDNIVLEDGITVAEQVTVEFSGNGKLVLNGFTIWVEGTLNTSENLSEIDLAEDNSRIELNGSRSQYCNYAGKIIAGDCTYQIIVDKESDYALYVLIYKNDEQKTVIECDSHLSITDPENELDINSFIWRGLAKIDLNDDIYYIYNDTLAETNDFLEFRYSVNSSAHEGETVTVTKPIEFPEFTNFTIQSGINLKFEGNGKLILNSSNLTFTDNATLITSGKGDEIQLNGNSRIVLAENMLYDYVTGGVVYNKGSWKRGNVTITIDNIEGINDIGNITFNYNGTLRVESCLIGVFDGQDDNFNPLDYECTWNSKIKVNGVLYEFYDIGTEGYPTAYAYLKADNDKRYVCLPVLIGQVKEDNVYEEFDISTCTGSAISFTCMVDEVTQKPYEVVAFNELDQDIIYAEYEYDLETFKNMNTYIYYLDRRIQDYDYSEVILTE